MKNLSKKNTRTITAIIVAGVLAIGTNSAFAGEVNGKGKVIPGGVNGKSDCSYSGQQDDPIADAGFFKGDRVQNWGQIPKAFRDYTHYQDCF